jgi:hypothetical protein
VERHHANALFHVKNENKAGALEGISPSHPGNEERVSRGKRDFHVKQRK